MVKFDLPKKDSQRRRRKITMAIKFTCHCDDYYRDQILSELPDPGTGLNDATLVAARKFKEWLGWPWQRTFNALLPAVNARRGRDCSREVKRQCDTVYNSETIVRATRVLVPTYEPDLWRRVGIPEQSVADLYEASPVKFEDDQPHTEEVIDHLFPGDPWLCCGLSVRKFETRRRSEWKGLLSQLAFIVPSPAIAKTGLTQEGYESEHALTMFPARKYLVYESDKIDKDEAASVILWLANKWPLKLVVDSANKSLHAWFDAEGTNEETLSLYFNDLIRLGADKQVKTLSQFVRMPDGLRDNCQRQSILFSDGTNTIGTRKPRA
jgi:hypothetical protein